MTTISTELNEPGAVSPSHDECDQPDQSGELLTQCADTQMRILRAIGQLSKDREVLSAMHEQNRSLLEGFHERETLLPVLRSLIAIADRCRQELGRFRRMLDGYESRMRRDVIELSLRQLVESRQADLIEIEEVLSRLGVDRYRHPSHRFDPSHQKCLKCVPTADPERHQGIERRVLPGYRRHQHVIRPELVHVYVPDPSDSPVS